MFFDQSKKTTEQLWWRITKEPFVPNYFQIRPVVFEKILKNHKNLNKYSKVQSQPRTIYAKIFSNHASRF